jgi:hypothetical protein
MNDLFRREKFARLRGQSLKRGNGRTWGVAYWPPSPDVAIFHPNDGQENPRSRRHRDRQNRSDVEAFNVFQLC